MFMLSMGAGTDMGFPDVCNTPVPPAVVPVPYPNISMTSTATPACYTILVDCMPALNQMSQNMLSNGDEAGLSLGMATARIMGSAEYMVGCFTILAGGAPAQRMTSVTGQNCMGVMPNAPGMCVAPSQITTLTLG